MRYRVTYARRDDLRKDLEAQLSRGGIFVNVPPPDDLSYGVRHRLDLVAPDGTVAKSDGEVLAAVPGVGIALSVPPEAVAMLRAALDRLTFDKGDGAPPRHERIDDAARLTPPSVAPVSASKPTTATGSSSPAQPATPQPATPQPATAQPATAQPATAQPATRVQPTADAQSWDSLSPADKMRLAQHGDRDERGAALRDKNRTLHPHVLKNPRITIEEVVAIARNPQSAPDLLKLVAERSEWMGRSQIAEALARNPKSPNDVGIRALAGCSAEALRQMAKGTGAPPHVIQAARKRVLG
ncbi:MAG: hypothetical protein U0326_01805 [Polyangiales bacterium]